MINHIGFIMDGNGRWAKSRGMKREEGYAYGLMALKKVLLQCQAQGIKAVTVYAFSTENWGRPESEIESITKVIERFNNTYDGQLKITYMGDIYSFSDSLIKSIEKVENNTLNNSGMTLNIALNYGGQDDIIRAANICYNHGDFSEEEFKNNLSSSFLPQLDLIVRTGGEKRLSNFMLFEAAYAELIFLDKMWPDMTEQDVDDIILEFESRQRKFGR